MDAMSTEPQPLVETLRGPTRTLDDGEHRQECALRRWRRAFLRQLEQYGLTQRRARKTRHRSRTPNLEATSTSRPRDDDLRAAGLADAGRQQAAIEPVEPSAPPPP